MISTVIPTLNAAEDLGACLDAILGAGPLVAELIVTDGGSSDATVEVARSRGALVIRGEKGRGAQLRRGAERARSTWLLFLHADTALDPSWADEVRPLLHDGSRAAAFSLAFTGGGRRAAIVAAGANARARLFCLPYGDQGLLISRRLYDEIGGYRDLPLFEDVDIIDRLIKAKGRRALTILKTRAATSPARYERDGYLARVLRNAASLLLYRCGADSERLMQHYQA
jgi:rSAM/selenodomain-associated transferase 2